MLVISDMIDSISEVQASEHDVTRINSIQDLYKDFRQDSKTPTFLLTYGGTHIGMMAQCGWDKNKALRIEERYHVLYQESDRWVQAKLDEASRTGYVTVAFGLRVRTPLLKQVVRGTSRTPHEAEAEGRTAGNALGQSWCLLNSRAWVEFMRKVRAHPEYRTLVRPCAQIHDAGYALIKDDLSLLRWFNEHLVEAVKWQDHPDIAHDLVKLGGEVSLFYPSWTYEVAISNGASEEEILSAVGKHLQKLTEKGIL